MKRFLFILFILSFSLSSIQSYAGPSKKFFKFRQQTLIMPRNEATLKFLKNAVIINQSNSDFVYYLRMYYN